MARTPAFDSWRAVEGQDHGKPYLNAHSAFCSRRIPKRIVPAIAGLNTLLERSVIKRAEVAHHPAENIDLSARRVKPVFVRKLHLSVLLPLHVELI
jgi:hypothetical protein